jgi:mannosyltransferase
MAAVGGLTLLGAALRIPTLPEPNVWFDEAVTLSLLRMDFAHMLARIPESESLPPLYYVVGWGWAQVFGADPTPVRLLSAVAGVATVPVAYAAIARLATRRIALAVAALVAVSPLLIWHSQDARAYSLLVLICAISLLTFARALDGPPRRLVAWVLAAALALATHYFSLFLIVGEAVWLLIRRPGRVAVAAVATVGALGGALLGLALEQASHGGAAWLSGRAAEDRSESLWPHFLLGYGADQGPFVPPAPAVPEALVITAAALAVAAVVLGVVSITAGGEAEAGSYPERRGLTIGATLALIALGVPLFAALIGIDYITTRNLLPSWLPLALVVGVGLGGRRAGLAGAVVGVLLCALLASITVLAAQSPSFERTDWRLVARSLGTAEINRAVIVPRSASMPLALEQAGLRTMPAQGARLQEIDVLSRTGRVPSCAARGFELVERRVIGKTTSVYRFRSARPLRVTPAHLLGRALIRRWGTTVLLVSSTSGARPVEPPTVSFCRPPTAGALAVVAIRTPCSEIVPAASEEVPPRG